MNPEGLRDAWLCGPARSELLVSAQSIVVEAATVHGADFTHPRRPHTSTRAPVSAAPAVCVLYGGSTPRRVNISHSRLPRAASRSGRA
jgi:hypothetical protein